MKITVNGKEEMLPGPTDIGSFLKQKRIERKGIVVELNREIIPAEAWDATSIGDQDALEILRFMGGGAAPWKTG